jgi:hypothetical protein
MKSSRLPPGPPKVGWSAGGFVTSDAFGFRFLVFVANGEPPHGDPK